MASARLEENPTKMRYPLIFLSLLLVRSFLAFSNDSTAGATSYTTCDFNSAAAIMQAKRINPLVFELAEDEKCKIMTQIS